MSSNAYLIKEINLKSTKNEIIIEKRIEKDPTFKIANYKIFKIFQEYGQDNTNEDLVGEISIDKKSFEKFMNSYNPSSYSKEEKRIIAKIESNLKNNEITFYEVF